VSLARNQRQASNGASNFLQADFWTVEGFTFTWRHLSQNEPQRHRLELLDGSVGASGSGSYQCFAAENLAGADADAARVLALAAYKDFLALLERRRSRDSHPEASQDRVREAAVTGKVLPFRLLLSDSVSRAGMLLS